jgi:hypothetical protein
MAIRSQAWREGIEPVQDRSGLDGLTDFTQ